MFNYEIVGRNGRPEGDDEGSLNSMSSIDLHSRNQAAEYEKIHLSSKPLTPLNLVISRVPSNVSNTEGDEWGDLSVSTTSPRARSQRCRSMSHLEIHGVNPISTPAEQNVFSHRKGRPLQSRGLQRLPDTIKMEGRESAFVPDGEIMYVSKFNLAPKKSGLSTMRPATLLQVKFDEGKRDVNSRMKIVSSPATGYTEPLGEARQVQVKKLRETQRMRRYGAGVAPLKRISNLESDLEQVLRKRRQEAGQSVINRAYLSPPRPDFANAELGETEKVDNRRSLALSDTMGEEEKEEDEEVGAPISTPAGHSGGSGLDAPSSLIFSECSSPPHSIQQDTEHDSVGGSTLSNYELSVPVDLKVRRGSSSQPTSFALAQEIKREEAQHRLSAKSGRTILTVPGNISSGKLFRLEDGHVDTTQFQHTREKLLSTKDKVYDGGAVDLNHGSPPIGGALPELANQDGTNDRLHEGADGDHALTPPVNGQVQQPDPPNPRDTMHTRYVDGKDQPVERSSRTLPGYIRRKVDVEVELKARVMCVSCGVEASMWCIECERSYCPLCWNKVSHHEFVDPDEVWINRKPPHPIMRNEHSSKGIQVHINSSGMVDQGLPQRKINERLSLSRGRVRNNRLSTFPAPSTIGDKGFVYAQTWADISDDGSLPSEHSNTSLAKSARDRDGLRLNVGEDEDMLNFEGDYMDSISHPGDRQQGSVQDSASETSSPGKYSFTRASPSTRRSPEKPRKELSERAQSPKTLMWQAATGHESKTGGLVNVSKFQPAKNRKPMTGITGEFYPDDWKDSRAGASTNFEIHKGVVVATRKHV